MRTALSRLATAMGLERRKDTGATRSEATRDTRVDLPALPPSDRRHAPRHAVQRPIVLVPVLPNGGPDWTHRVEGVSLDVSEQGIGLLLSGASELPTMSAILLAPQTDGTVRCAGLDVRHSQRQLPGGQLWVGASAGGFAAALLDPANLSPRFCPHALQFTWNIPEDVLRLWADVGVLRPTAPDRVQVCPKCHKLLTYRHGCRHCGSSQVDADQLLHHFACAHVGLLADFAREGELACPKCHVRWLVIGSDFEHQTGPYRCRACQWSGAELAPVAQCLGCHLRFPGEQAVEIELRGFHADRLDLLALVPAS